MQQKKLFALIDCNNFFVSCERVFRPDLVNKPMLVASSNDGCAVARSNEVKALGIPMGAPVFKFKDIIFKNNVQVFSANFHLYGDISRRLTQLLSKQAPAIEVYSIDESFLDISDIPMSDVEKWGETLANKILHDIGIPVSIGIGPTKTLAKLASELAKKDLKGRGVKITTPDDPELKAVRVEDIWGIGRKNAPKLRARNIGNAHEITKSNKSTIRSTIGSIVEERIFLELSGIPCYDIESTNKPQKVISATRTFGHDTDKAYVVESALADLTARACHNLRKDRQLVRKISIFVTSNRFSDNYSVASKSIRLDWASSSTGQIIANANSLFAEIYNPKIKYHRAGITLTELTSDSSANQIGLIDSNKSLDQIAKNNLMKDVDSINKRYGRGKVHYATQDISKDWLPRKNSVSQAYTTNWDELPKIH